MKIKKKEIILGIIWLVLFVSIFLIINTNNVQAKDICNEIERCSDLNRYSDKCVSTTCTHKANLECSWNNGFLGIGRKCELKTFIVRWSVGKYTLADELGRYYQRDITNKRFPSGMPRYISVKGSLLKLEWDESRNKWDYHTSLGKHYSVYGGEKVNIRPDTRKLLQIQREKDICITMDSCSDLNRYPSKCSENDCTKKSNLKCVWNGRSCEIDTLIIRSDVGMNTIADELGIYYKTKINNPRSKPKNLPKEISVGGTLLKLEWDESRNKWDYITRWGNHYSVYGGEKINVKPNLLDLSSSEKYFYESNERRNKFIEKDQAYTSCIRSNDPHLERDACAWFVRKVFECIYGEGKAERLGIKGNAWDFPSNIRGTEIFNDKEDAFLDYNSLVPGDIICMYYAYSDYRPNKPKNLALKRSGKSYNTEETDFTHVALYLGKNRWNQPMIIHHFHGPRKDDLRSFARRGDIKIRRVLRPNERILLRETSDLPRTLAEAKQEEKLIAALEEETGLNKDNPEFWAEKIIDYSTSDSDEYLSLSSSIIYAESSFSLAPLNGWKRECLFPLFPTTLGPMQISVQNAITISKEIGSNYNENTIRRDLCSSNLNGLKYGMLQLDKAISIYNKDPSLISKDKIKFIAADYNGGLYLSRNAAFQSQLSALMGKTRVQEITGQTELDTDGFLLYSNSEKKSNTEKVAIALMEGILTEKQVHDQLSLGKEADFEDTELYKKVKQKHNSRFEKTEYAIVPTFKKANKLGKIGGTIQGYAYVVEEKYDYFCNYMGC